MRFKKLNTVDQPELLLVRKTGSVDVPLDLVIRQTSFAAAIALCVQVSGLEEKEVYMSLDIDPGHWTRIMKGDAHFPVNKLTTLMELCGNEAPVLWLVHAQGYDPNSMRKRETETEKRLRETQEALEKERLERQTIEAAMRRMLVGNAA